MIGIGIGLGRQRFGIFSAYQSRIIADGGVVEAGGCVDAVSTLLQSASLLLIPSGYKGGKLYSQIPTNGNGDLTWTRGSDAFRTNASGLIQRVPWNLASYSEDFSNAYWTKNVSATITANSTTAPDGTTTADTLNVIASTFSGIYRAISGTSANYTVSIYAKKNTKNWLYLFDTTGNSARAWFDLDNGVLGTVANGYTATITNVGDGWYRCTLSNNNAQTLGYYQLGLADANNGVTPTSSGSAFIWGAQLVEGTTAQTYLPTTDRLNFPRLSYMYGSCPSVLLEPQRTNLALWSEDITNTGGWTLNNVTASSNTTTAPNGTTTADTLTATASTASHNIKSVDRLPATYTGSIYAKKGTHNFLQIWDGGASQAFANFNLNTGVIGTVGTSVTATITSVGDGWYKCSITYTASGGSAFRYALISSSTAAHNESWTANGTETIFLWGGQTEVGAYPTTYIPTTSATATRVADSFSRNNIYTNGLITSSGGTWFFELRNNISYVRDTGSEGIFIGDTSFGTTNSLQIGTPIGGGRLRVVKRIAGTGTELYLTLTDTVKIAMKWNGTTADIFVNGTKQVSATAFTTTNMEFLVGLSADSPKFIQQMALYPTPLTDTQCQTLTTL